MGMFDSVCVDCPKCGHNIEFQSKAGACGLGEYNINNCPAGIAEDLNNDVERCPQCGHNIVFKSRTIAQLWMELEED